MRFAPNRQDVGRHAFALNLLDAGRSAGAATTLLEHSSEKIVRSRVRALVDRDVTASANDLTEWLNALEEGPE